MSFEDYDKYDETPEEVPNWYLFQQNRSIQYKQGLMFGLLGFNATILGLLLALFLPAGYIFAFLGLVIAYLSILKAEARDPDSWARTVCDKLGVGSWVDAETVIAERKADQNRSAVTDGGEER